MNNIFDIVGGKVVVSPQGLAIPAFKVLWARDKTKSKNRAEDEISYIVFLCDESLNNPYRGYQKEQRDPILKESIFKDPNWEPDTLVEKGIEAFELLQTTPTLRLYISSLSATDKLSEYFSRIDFNQVGEDGKPIYSAKELSQNLKDVGNIVKSLKQLEQVVRQEQNEASTARGGGAIGEFERSMDILGDEQEED